MSWKELCIWHRHQRLLLGSRFLSGGLWVENNAKDRTTETEHESKQMEKHIRYKIEKEINNNKSN